MMAPLADPHGGRDVVTAAITCVDRAVTGLPMRLTKIGPWTLYSSVSQTSCTGSADAQRRTDDPRSDDPARRLISATGFKSNDVVSDLSVTFMIFHGCGCDVTSTRTPCV